MGQHNFELFEEYWRGKLSLIKRASMLRARLGESSRSFSFWVILSIILHLTVLGLLVNRHSLRHSSNLKGDILLTDREAFFQAMSILQEKTNENKGSEIALTPALSDEEIARLLAEAPALDPQFTEQQRIEIFLDFLKHRLRTAENHSKVRPIDSLNLWASQEMRPAQGLLILEKGTRLFDSGPYASGGAALHKVSSGLSRQLALLRASERWERDQTPVRGGYVRVMAKAGFKDVPADYYFRDCPYEEILTVREKIFYFVRGFPVLESSGDFERKVIKNRQGFPPHLEKGLVVFLLESGHMKPATSIAKKHLEPLVLGSGEIEMILDELMELPEEEQFMRFVEDYLERYNPDEGDIAVLTREFMYKNLGAVFIITSPFVAAFDFLEEIYFNKRTQGYLETYWKKNWGTKTGTEILFILAELVDFEKRALVYLFDSYESALKVLAGKERHLDVFSQKAKAFVLKETMETILDAMEIEGIRSEAELYELYEDYEASIYRLLAELGGETRDRALFDLGCLHWNSGKYEDAVSTWKSVRSSYKRPVFKEVQRLIENFKRVTDDVPADYSLVAPRVNTIIAKEYSGRADKLLRRLIKFKKWSLRYTRPTRN